MSRRRFIKTSAAATALGTLTAGVGPVFAAGSDKIRVGLIGCGVRGTGAAMNCVLSSPGVEIVALGDMFQDRVDAALKRLKDNHQPKEWSCSQPWKHAEQVTASRDTCFAGFDAYRKVIASDVNLIILATPPGFRPLHLKAAVEAGRNVFMEKPVAVDPVGVRSIIASSDLAQQKGLAIVAGTQRRHQNAYVEVMKRVREGAIGEVLAGEAYWNGGCVRHYGFYHPRQPGWTDMEYQLRNWYFYTGLSGDHIVEQHVHNLDVINWVNGAPPVRAMGMGGRQARTDPRFGNIFDHFAIEYEYENGFVLTSMCRQTAGCANRVEERVRGADGWAKTTSGFAEIYGPNAWKFTGRQTSPYVQEHIDLIAAIRSGNRVNELQQVAESTLTAIMGRMSAYTGKEVTWEFALNSKLDLTPPTYSFGPLEVRPVAIPGKAELI